jgi:DNA-binding XRE family transcriptional regulator
MVTRIHRTAVRHLYLKEWREHFGVSPDQMAGRIGIERESVYRWEREQNRLNPEKQTAYAEALGIEPEDLWRYPTKPSLDALLRGKDAATIDMAADIVRRLVGKAS